MEEQLRLMNGQLSRTEEKLNQTRQLLSEVLSASEQERVGLAAATQQCESGIAEQLELEITELDRLVDEKEEQSKLQIQKLAELQAKMSEILRLSSADIPVGSEAGNNSNSVTEMQQQLYQTNELLRENKQELNKTRKHLLDVQERQTVSQQVRIAAQQREIQESDNSEQLILTPQRQPTTGTGSVSLFQLSMNNILSRIARKLLFNVTLIIIDVICDR